MATGHCRKVSEGPKWLSEVVLGGLMVISRGFWGTKKVWRHFLGSKGGPGGIRGASKDLNECQGSPRESQRYLMGFHGSHGVQGAQETRGLKDASGVRHFRGSPWGYRDSKGTSGKFYEV